MLAVRRPSIRALLAKLVPSRAIAALAAAVIVPASASAQTNPPPDEFQAQALRSDAELAQLVAVAEGLLGDSKHIEALARLTEVIEGGDDTAAYFHDAEFLTGIALFHLGLYQSSSLYFEKVLDAEPQSARYPDVLPWLVAVHEKVPGEQATLERMADFDPATYPPDIKDRIYFYVGQFHYYQGTLKKALESLSKVGPSSEETYVRARYIEGVVHVRNNNAKAASDAFKDVLRFKEEVGLKSELGLKVYRMSLLALARIFYTIQKYDTAIKYYDMIPEYSDDWLESLMEVSWAYYQTERFGRALGNLHTLNSPYFEEEFYPESRVLEAVILYSTCHFDDTLASVNAFIKGYRDLFKELDEQLKVPRDPNQFYGWLARLSKSGTDISPRLKRIFNAALADKNLGRSFGFILSLNDEIDTLKKLSQNATMTGFAAALINEVTSFRSLVIGEAGSLARSRLESIRDALRAYLADGLKVRFETLKAQEKAINTDEKSVTGDGEVGAGDIDREHLYWPFKGEYWRDELDAYTVGIVSVCATKESQKPVQEESKPALEDNDSAPQGDSPTPK
jgi:tetratricopeptide (TPR) repeat protein